MCAPLGLFSAAGMIGSQAAASRTPWRRRCAAQCRVVKPGCLVSTGMSNVRVYGPAGPTAGSAYRPGLVLARRPRRVHSASWVSMFGGGTPSRPASSRPGQSRPGSLAMIWVILSLLVPGLGWWGRGLGESFLRARLRAAGRSGGGTRMVISTRVRTVVCCGRPVVAVEVAGGGAFDLAGAVAGPPGRQEAVQDGAADPADARGVAGIGDAAGGGDLVAGCFQGGGEAGPVRVGAGHGLGGRGHRHPDQLVDGEQRPQFLFGAGPVAGAHHVPAEESVAQRQVGDLDLPALVVEPDQLAGRVAQPVGQRGDEAVVVPDPGPVGTGDLQVRLDDPHLETVDL